MSVVPSFFLWSRYSARRIVSSLSLLALTVGLAACGSSTPIGSNVPVNYNPAPARTPGGTYTVQRGDTIYSVARQLNMSVRALIDANNLQPPFQLTLGQVLVMPGSAGGYVVTKDDTLLGIARKTGVSFSTLVRLNNLSAPYVVKVGQHLKLPATSGDAAVASANPPPQESSRPVAVSPPTALPAPGAATPAPAASERPASGYSSVSERENKPQAVIPPPPPPAAAAQSQQAQQQQASQQAAAPQQQASQPSQPSFQASPPPPPPAPPAAASSTTSASSAAAAAADDAEPPAAEQRVAAAPAAPPAPVSPPPSSGKGYVWPARGTLLAEFGTTGKGQHNDGINIAVARGTPVVAAQDGVVAYAGNELRGFGNLLLIKHADGWMTAYAHNDTLLVKRGDTVRRGQQIAKAGDSGGVAQPQLHFEVRHGTRAVDPMTFLGGKTTPASSSIDPPDPG
ncbi:peptidoglycan DD-metalloendopeptidase family protein [Telmatospirillum sp.]|uniref:peptidoglycan DD-metalloendopeptidase family protein n=1 Tax=Telmatospirillum sp. TaxID=2079197 RepID=UPI0028407694|nr:peptidoglycan DD-metalloendopeptidase family protein [Telmatospirillum sp.]MDR3436000.1 peptidoglycan DD-metalloendopeptidase family protein [Telmatospirillum sp.]